MNKLDKIIDGLDIEYDAVLKELAERIKCKDGTTLSVQASKAHYCTPRSDVGPYTHVEVGYPSVEPPETWMQYFDGDWEKHDRTDSVYGYVPVELVRNYVQLHGGEEDD